MNRRKFLSSVVTVASASIAGCSGEDYPSEKEVEGNNQYPSAPNDFNTELKTIEGNAFTSFEMKNFNTWFFDRGASHPTYGGGKAVLGLTGPGALDTVRTVHQSEVDSIHTYPRGSSGGETKVPERASKVTIDVAEFIHKYTQGDYYTGIFGLKNDEVVARAIGIVSDKEPIPNGYLKKPVSLKTDSPYIQWARWHDYLSQYIEPNTVLFLRLTDTPEVWPKRIEVYANGLRISNQKLKKGMPTVRIRLPRGKLDKSLRVAFVGDDDKTLDVTEINLENSDTDADRRADFL